VVAVNHHNALVDGVLLVAHFPRRLVPVAKAPLFSTPLIGWFLRLIGALPVHRRQEGGTDPGRNAALFAASSSALRAGQAILIFPEGVSQPEPTLMPLRTGAARMLLAAETEGTGPVTLLPVGLMLHEPGTFRTGWAVLSMGEPVPTADCVALARTEPEEAARRLTARLGEAMRALIAMVDDRQTLRLVEHAERLWRQERGGEWDATARADWRRRATRAYRYLSHQDPARLSLLRAQMERYVKDLDEAGVRTAVLLRPPAPAVALRYAAGQLAALLGGLPLALWGLLTHALPYWLTWVAARVLRPEATWRRPTSSRPAWPSTRSRGSARRGSGGGSAGDGCSRSSWCCWCRAASSRSPGASDSGGSTARRARSCTCSSTATSRATWRSGAARSWPTWRRPPRWCPSRC